MFQQCECDRQGAATLSHVGCYRPRTWDDELPERTREPDAMPDGQSRQRERGPSELLGNLSQDSLKETKVHGFHEMIIKARR